ncbi:MAG TPA: cytochrome c [Thermoanaerobaculia bacterium]|nr:cytochrome c [Thermoanaerobaculia bacterium]
MRRGAPAALLAVLTLVVIVFVSGVPPASGKSPGRKHRRAKPVPHNFDKQLPVLGTRLAQLPPGEVKALADQACLSCHSADILWQQRLTDKQWSAEVNKMIGWGAQVPAEQKDALVAYLLQNFGPDNEKFQPVVTRPVGR